MCKKFILLVFLCVMSISFALANNKVTMPNISSDWDWPPMDNSEPEIKLMSQAKLLLIEVKTKENKVTCYNGNLRKLKNGKIKQNVITYFSHKDSTEYNRKEDLVVVKFYSYDADASDSDSVAYLHRYNINDLSIITTWMIKNAEETKKIFPENLKIHPDNLSQVITGQEYLTSKIAESEKKQEYLIYGMLFLIFLFITGFIVFVCRIQKVLRQQKQFRKDFDDTLKDNNGHSFPKKLYSEATGDFSTLKRETNTIRETLRNINYHINQLIEKQSSVLERLNTFQKEIINKTENLEEVFSTLNNVKESQPDPPKILYEVTPADDIVEKQSHDLISDTPIPAPQITQISQTEKEILDMYNSDKEGFKNDYNPIRVMIENWDDSVKTGPISGKGVPYFQESNSGSLYIVEEKGTFYTLPYNLQFDSLPKPKQLQILACFEGREEINETNKITKCAIAKRSGDGWELLEKGTIE